MSRDLQMRTGSRISCPQMTQMTQIGMLPIVASPRAPCFDPPNCLHLRHLRHLRTDDELPFKFP